MTEDIYYIKADNLFYDGGTFTIIDETAKPFYVLGDAQFTCVELIANSPTLNIYIVSKDNKFYERSKQMPACNNCAIYYPIGGECAEDKYRPEKPYKYMAHTMCDFYTPLAYRGRRKSK